MEVLKIEEVPAVVKLISWRAEDNQAGSDAFLDFINENPDYEVLSPISIENGIFHVSLYKLETYD